ncbi:senescence-related protein [Cinnamomum micranthum f. kanehirae]|uniref:Senescence-related protein n=1 Tax=Cinnamomum micranthum f. kanehirae TaxID=337451 RepID=A0A443PZG6_9MAGN|nr:senescence-related protein [Cinnamomum micranthum f. kanehirae]
MESPKKGAMGSSILVPSVQELAKENMVNVPPRYIRPDQDPPLINAPLPSISIPIIDMDKLLQQESSAAELERLHSACKDWGFFQLVNHGVSSSLVEKMKSEIKDFFKLPLEEKKRFWQEPGDVEGFGQAFVISEEQKLDWGDMFFLTSLPLHMRKPRLFDHLPLSFRETMEAYSMEVNKLAMSILGLMARALGMKAEEITELFDEPFQGLRMNYYPPCPQPESVIGLSPHSDSVGLTVLLQVGEMEGLQIRKEGLWIPIVTNGIYRSIEHRVMVNSMQERLSIAAFHSPKYTAEIGPARSLINAENPALFRRVGADKYYRDQFTRKLQGKAYLDSMRINYEEFNNTAS